MAADNRVLGIFNLDGIPPAPRGVPQIEVAFDIDANGILHVAAKDLGTGKEQKIRIESSSKLSEDEIEKMVKDAEEHAAEDREKREQAQARNEADSLVYQVEKLLREHGGQIDADEKAKVEQEVESLKKVLDNGDTPAIKAGIESLTQASHRLSEAMYRAQAQASQGDSGAAGGAGESAASDGGSTEDENVVDAEFEVKEEKKS
jgi:molecular chaperone DnaK